MRYGMFHICLIHEDRGEVVKEVPHETTGVPQRFMALRDVIHLQVLGEPTRTAVVDTDSHLAAQFGDITKRRKEAAEAATLSLLREFLRLPKGE